MSLPPGTRLGPYEITAALGAGGMGEVYRAREPKLDREVAIKVLPADMAQDPERLARFEREARLLASLNHSNIAHVYGFEAATLPDGSTAHFLAMELVEGEDLSERLKRGVIPVDEAIAIARQIAEGLEEAHERGIIHRDLKPANVKVTPDGKVKVLDFGLAKALEGETGANSGSSQLSHSPTMSRHATEAGMIMGTAAYMSPEQARGKAVDKRADIWSFGVVLFEMLTGNRLFGGETVSDVLVAVLTLDPDLDALPVQTPSHVRQLLRRCLDRNPRNRLHDIADARVTLDDPLTNRNPETPSNGTSGARPSLERPAWIPWVVGIALGAAALGILDRTVLSPGTGVPTETLRLEVLPPAGTTSSGPFDIAPDGRSIVFVAADQNKATALYVRQLDTLEAKKLPGTEGAESPFFSPNGRSIGFFAGNKLQRIDLAGGPPRELAPVADPRGGTWGSAGVIVFAPEGGGPLLSVPENGGETTVITQLDPTRQETSHRWPQFLPDGKHFVFMSRKPSRPRLALETGSISGGERVLVLADIDAGGRHAEGRLYFQRRTTLFSQRFETGGNSLAGEPEPVAEDAWIDTGTDGLAAFAVARGGRLAYRRGGMVTSQLAWLDRQGRTLETVGEPGLLGSPELSPDGRRILVTRTSATRNQNKLVMVDASNPAGTMIGGPDLQVARTIFSPDGSRIVFADDRSGPFDLYEAKLAESGKDAPLLVTPLWKYPETWSPDGRFIVYAEVDPKTRANLWVLPLTAGAKPYPFLDTAASESTARFSPDGRFLAYSSDETGRMEIFVQPFPATGARWQVSTTGGTQPGWRGDAGELVYVASDLRLMSVAVSPSSPGLAFGPPRALFRIPLSGTLSVSGRDYALSRDGQRFLVLQQENAAASSPITVVIGPAASGESRP